MKRSRYNKKILSQIIGKKKLDIVQFECGCTIDMSYIEKSMVGGKPACLIHRKGVAAYIRHCLHCKKAIAIPPSERKKASLETQFCSKKCADAFRVLYRETIEENPPVRKTDCARYEECLNASSRENRIDMGCEECRNYIRQ